MRQQEQQLHDTRPTDDPDAAPETVRSEPVPVPTASSDDRPDGAARWADQSDDGREPDDAREHPGELTDQDKLATDHDPDTTHDPDAIHDPDTTHDPDAIHDPDMTQDPDAIHDPDMTQDPDATHDPDTAHHHDATHHPDAASPGDRDSTDLAERDVDLAEREPVVDGREPEEFDGREPEESPTELPESTAVGAARPDPAEDGVLSAGQVAEDGKLRPGAASVETAGALTTEPLDTLVSADAAEGFRDRWRDVQLRFVDDPQGAAVDARQLVDDVVESLTAALTSQRDALNDWDGSGENDTERLRVAVRRYRDLVDRLLDR